MMQTRTITVDYARPRGYDVGYRAENNFTELSLPVPAELEGADSYRVYFESTVGEDGTIDNPITAAAGMRYFKDKYYLDGGKIYKCIRDDSNGQGTILQYLPSQLVDIYFEEVI